MFDKRSNKIEATFFDLDDKSVLNAYHKWISELDEQSNEIERAYLDPNDKSILHKDGHHENVSKFNEQRNGLELEINFSDFGDHFVFSKNR